MKATLTRQYLKAFLILFLFVSTGTFAQTRINTFFTQEEVNIWKQRAANGPYKTLGDAQPNSPGDWTRILTNANAFISNPIAERWKGVITNTCVQVGADEPAMNGKKLRDAAFVYLITGDVKYAHAVRNELLGQIKEPYTDFSVTSRWCDNVLRDAPPAYPICDWLMRLYFAYNYIKPILTENERSQIVAWFYKGAVYFQRNMDADLGKLYVNRNAGDWTMSNYGKLMNSSLGRTTHYNGYKTASLGRYYNNRRGSQILFFTLFGIDQNIASMKNSGKLFIKEALMFATYPDGTFAEFQRWREDFADIGISYSFLTISQMLSMADYFARTGDFEMYNFTTSRGLYGTAGGNKNLLLLTKAMLNHMDGTIKRYGTEYSTKIGTTAALIDGNNTESGRKWFTVCDIWFSQPNIYYKNTYIKDAYTRRGAGTRPYPVPGSDANIGMHRAWGGPWDVYPGFLFMYGQMEGKVWPYPKTSNTSNDILLSSTAGSLTEELWENIQGKTVAKIPFDKTPASIGEITSFETASNTDDHFGRRIRGYVHPRVSGEYTFWIAGDDHCELWLSKDENPENKEQIAGLEGWTSEREWNKFTSQQSVKITLQAGKKYYVEVLQKEHEGKDHLSVGWQLPDGAFERPIPGSRLSPFVIDNTARIAAVKDLTEAELYLQVYPNPFQDQLTLKTATTTAGEMHITISDLLGKICYQYTTAVMAGESEITLDLSRENVQSGIYLLQTVSPDNRKKLIKIIKP